MSRLKPLKTLSALLAGDLPVKVDWMSVLALANEALVTPQIYSAALQTGTVSQFPSEVRIFLHEVWLRNRERNRRLFEQLREAIATLNAAGIEPVLLKGAAHWVALGRPAEHDRMLTDIDLLVGDEHAAAALSALEATGYVAHKLWKDPGKYVAADLGRPDCVGVIDLHRRPPGREAEARAAMALDGELATVSWDGVRAKAPSPALQVFLLVLHDQFEDGGYWRGKFVLRHLMDIADLTRQPRGVDWDVVAGLANTRLVRNTTDAQLLAAASICGAVVPRTAQRPWVRMQYARLQAQFAWPHLKPLLVQFSG
ncbi:nucleotidyltransferase family protein [Phenylobacterium sp. LjRoot219]|uniref:nucleotidyltransferase family protein n=1 Tax=Phenylobacterium sp. LjRoot219 TaxID=3342283 RepID=UPI003ECE8A3E